MDSSAQAVLLGKEAEQRARLAAMYLTWLLILIRSCHTEDICAFGHVPMVVVFLHQMADDNLCFHLSVSMADKNTPQATDGMCWDCVTSMA
jgi:hypothetical protein